MFDVYWIRFTLARCCYHRSTYRSLNRMSALCRRCVWSASIGFDSGWYNTNQTKTPLNEVKRSGERAFKKNLITIVTKNYITFDKINKLY